MPTVPMVLGEKINHIMPNSYLLLPKHYTNTIQYIIIYTIKESKMKYCTTCKNLEVKEVQFRKDGTAPTRQGICEKYHCTLQATDGTYVIGTKCREEDGFEAK